jgi:hypothetical protein
MFMSLALVILELPDGKRIMRRDPCPACADAYRDRLAQVWNVESC